MDLPRGEQASSSREDRSAVLTSQTLLFLAQPAVTTGFRLFPYLSSDPVTRNILRDMPGGAGLDPRQLCVMPVDARRLLVLELLNPELLSFDSLTPSPIMFRLDIHDGLLDQPVILLNEPIEDVGDESRLRLSGLSFRISTPSSFSLDQISFGVASRSQHETSSGSTRLAPP